MNLDSLNLIQLKFFYQNKTQTQPIQKTKFQSKTQNKYLNKFLSLIIIILFTILVLRINQQLFLVYLFLIFAKINTKILDQRIQRKKDLKKKLQEEKKISEGKAKRLLNLKQFKK